MPFDSENQFARDFVAPHPSRPAIPEGHRRLLVLAEFLETHVPAARFNLELWSNAQHGGIACGTAACAVGWATAIPEFHAAGLHLRNRQCGTYPVYKSADNMDAARLFFSLVGDQAFHLFDFENYEGRPTPGIVAARIRSFVAEQSYIAARKAEVQA